MITDAAESDRQRAIEHLLAGKFLWTTTAPLVAPAKRTQDPCCSVKDPTVVFHEGRWHLFCTIRSQKRTHQIEYLSFADWKDADRAPRHILKLRDGYFCAPQVFYFTPRRKWYLLCQVAEPSRKPSLQPAWSTTATLGEPDSWSKPTLLFTEPPKLQRWIDFWIICDDAKAHLFFTSLDGQMWRAETKLADFPGGWNHPRVALRGDIFEASHTYRLKGLAKYLTLVEAQAEGRRYYKAYLADRLDGDWTPLAATREKPFASPVNVTGQLFGAGGMSGASFQARPACSNTPVGELGSSPHSTNPLPVNVREAGAHWTDSFSHGELLRAGSDEKLEVDPARLRFLFQGVGDRERAGKKYGEIPWRLGMLEMVVQ